MGAGRPQRLIPPGRPIPWLKVIPASQQAREALGGQGVPVRFGLVESMALLLLEMNTGIQRYGYAELEQRFRQPRTSNPASSLSERFHKHFWLAHIAPDFPLLIACLSARAVTLAHIRRLFRLRQKSLGDFVLRKLPYSSWLARLVSSRQAVTTGVLMAPTFVQCALANRQSIVLE